MKVTFIFDHHKAFQGTVVNQTCHNLYKRRFPLKAELSRYGEALLQPNVLAPVYG